MSILNDDIDYEPLYEGFITNLKEKYHIQIEQNDIHWIGFWSQGDGLCFDFNLTKIYELVNFLEVIKAPYYEIFKKLWENEVIINCGIRTINNHFATNYCHSNTRNINFWFDYSSNSFKDIKFTKDINIVEENISEIEKYIKEWYRTTCDGFYDTLNVYYQEQCAEMEEELEEMTISDKIDSRIDPEMTIEKVVEMINDAQDLSYTKGEGMVMVEKFIENFNKEYLIIKKIN